MTKAETSALIADRTFPYVIEGRRAGRLVITWHVDHLYDKATWRRLSGDEFHWTVRGEGTR